MVRKTKRGIALVVIYWMLAGSALALESKSYSDESSVGSLKTYNAQDGSYTVHVPAEWALTWSNAPNGLEPAELNLTAPMESWPSHVMISILHYADALKTSERYLFDLSHPSIGGQDEVRSTPMVLNMAGTSVTTLDVISNRYLQQGMTWKKIPSFIRYVIIPANQGFFVLRFDAPERIAKTYRPLFDQVVKSFVLESRNTVPVKDQLSHREYEVYTDFFQTQAPRGLDTPQFFDNVPKCRLVYSQTIADEKPHDPAWPGKDFGVLEAELISDFLAKNSKKWQLTDRIMVQNLVVIPAKEFDERLSEALKGPTQWEAAQFFLQAGIVTLSRVGFNNTGDTALLGMTILHPRATYERYIVLMKKNNGKWGIAKVAMEDFWIH